MFLGFWASVAAAVVLAAVTFRRSFQAQVHVVLCEAKEAEHRARETKAQKARETEAQKARGGGCPTRASAAAEDASPP